MPFPWEQAINAGVQIGGQYAAQKKQSGAQEKEIGAAFDQLDKQLAGALSQLLAKPSVTVDELNAAGNAYGQLQGFANQYSGVAYVARQWGDEKPRYEQVFQALIAKLPAVQAVQTGTVTPIGSTGGASGGGGEGAGAAGTAPGATGATAPLIPGVDNSLLILAGAALVGFLLLRGR